jgi:hypothetical protein
MLAGIALDVVLFPVAQYDVMGTLAIAVGTRDLDLIPASVHEEQSRCGCST